MQRKFKADQLLQKTLFRPIALSIPSPPIRPFPSLNLRYTGTIALSVRRHWPPIIFQAST